MEATVVNRLIALVLLAAVSGGTALGQSTVARNASRTSSPSVRNQFVSERSSGVPRPARPAGRPSTRVIPASAVMQSAMDEEVVYEQADEGEMVLGDSYDPNEGLSEIGAGCSACGDAGCSSCGIGSRHGMTFDLCNPGLNDSQFCICLPSHGWVSVEYLDWYQRGMTAPELVTTSRAGTSQAAAGVLPAATVLYGGNNDILNDRMSGTRVRFGWWFANHPNLGIEGEYLGFGTQNESFDQQSTGATILARPFFNAVTGLNDAELVSFPGVLSGRVRTNATSKLDGAAVRFRKIVCCSSRCGCSPLTCGPTEVQTRIDATVGWRYYQLNESLGIREDLTSLDANNPGTFVINDNFRTLNQFNGAEIGFQWFGRRGRWSLDALMRLGIGNTRQLVTIGGSTQTTQNGQTTTATGGLLAQRTNIGTLTRNQFGIAPELGATLGYQLTHRMRLTAGYSFIYWSNVVRPGDQIDTTVNPNLLPPENPTQNAFLNPRFAFRETDYWIQGLSLGGDYRW